jgi:glycosyltransferase involved in cell wall biosynthesis
VADIMNAAMFEPMHVAHIITRMILGGAQENTLLTCEDQHRLGDRVTLVTGPALGPEGSLLDRARRAGFAIEVIPELRRSLNPYLDWVSYRKLVKRLRELRPDVVHTHSSKAGILGRAAAAALNIPCVHTIHGSPFHAYQSRLAHWFYVQCERWAARRCDRLISVADAMTHQYVAAGVAPREKFTTVYSGMEVEPFVNPPRDRQTVRRELGFRDEDIVVVKVARLFELKGHDDVIAAAKIVVPRNPRVRFLFIGDGVLRETLDRDIAAAGLADHFRFTGLVPPQSVPELLAATDIVVHASLREGLARVLPQGMIGGKPVVSYDIDGAREVVITGETGVLLPPRDVSGMATALLELAADPELRRRLGETGRSRWTEQFRHETMTARLREIYAAHCLRETTSPP